MRKSLPILLLAVILVNPAGAAEIDRCVPEDAEVIVAVNFRQLLDAAVVKKHFLPDIKKAWERDGFKPRQLAERLKFDPFTDIASITVASPIKKADEKALIVLRGRFDLDAIQTAAEIYANRGADDFKMHKQDELRYYEFKLPRTDRTAFVSLLDKETLVLSPSRAALLSAAARQQSKKQDQPVKELRELLSKIDGKETVWLAGVISDDVKKGIGGNPQVRKVVDSLQSVRGGIRVTEGLQASLVIQTNDPRTAGEIRKFLEGIKSLVELAVQDDDHLGTLPADLLEAVKLATDKETVTISGRLDAEQIDKSLKSKPKSGAAP
jgi:hypothetical protein